jgi:hypothetical protein
MANEGKEIDFFGEGDHGSRRGFGPLGIAGGLLVALIATKMWFQHQEEMARLSMDAQLAQAQSQWQARMKAAGREEVATALREGERKATPTGTPEHVDAAGIRLLDAMVSAGSVPTSPSGKLATSKIIDLVGKLVGMGVDVAKDSPLNKLKDELLSTCKEITVAEAKKLIDKYLGLTEDGGKKPAAEVVPYALNLTVYGQVNGQPLSRSSARPPVSPP